MNILRRYIRSVLIESQLQNWWGQLNIGGSYGESDGQDDDDLLTEPDDTDEDSKHEVNAISAGGGSMVSTGAISGVTTPLGTGPAGPKRKKKKKKKLDSKPGSNWYKATAK